MSGEYRAGFADGYWQAVGDASWECDDCGNSYGPDVDACPNFLMDRAAVKVLRANDATDD